MEPRNAIPKKHFVSKEEINLTPQDRFSNIDWWKYGCECKLLAAFAESLCLLFRLKFYWAAAPLLVTRINIIYLVDDFFFLFLV